MRRSARNRGGDSPSANVESALPGGIILHRNAALRFHELSGITRSIKWDRKHNSYLKILDDITAMLESHGEKHWARWIGDDASRLRSGDLTAIAHFLGAFGGTGSLNDLTICPENGHRVTEAETAAANERLLQALSEAWKFGSHVVRTRSMRVTHPPPMRVHLASLKFLAS